MNKTFFNRIAHTAAIAASFSICACATSKPSAAPSRPAPVAASTAAPGTAVTAAANPIPTGPLMSVGGVIVSGDAAAHTLTIKDYSGRTRSFVIADGAHLTKGGANSTVQLSDLSAGDRVRLKVRDNVAASVHVMIKPAS